MLRVFVALGKQLPKNNAMIEDTAEVARLLAKYNCTLVQGGARTGLMGTVVSEFQKYSDDVVMIVPEVHKADLEGTKSKEHYIVEGEADRLKITINTCDMMIVLPGGTGTMAELNYYNETCKSGEHSAKLVMLNTKGFYNKLFKFVKHQVKCGFMKKEHFKYDVINNTKQLEAILQQLITQKQEQLHINEMKADKENLIKEAKQVAKVKPLKATAKKSTTSKKSSTQVKTKKETSKKPTTTKTVAKKEVAKPATKTVKTTKNTASKSATTKKPVAKPVTKKAEKTVAKKTTKK